MTRPVDVHEVDAARSRAVASIDKLAEHARRLVVQDWPSGRASALESFDEEAARLQDAVSEIRGRLADLVATTLIDAKTHVVPLDDGEPAGHVYREAHRVLEIFSDSNRLLVQSDAHGGSPTEVRATEEQRIQAEGLHAKRRAIGVHVDADRRVERVFDLFP